MARRRLSDQQFAGPLGARTGPAAFTRRPAVGCGEGGAGAAVRTPGNGGHLRDPAAAGCLKRCLSQAAVGVGPSSVQPAASMSTVAPAERVLTSA